MGGAPAAAACAEVVVGVVCRGWKFYYRYGI